ncbi:hypothetical protein BLNAU_14965 [Blattamonas nauphoetae]|uniref:Uncharacterized protein n=1 Tax=Blattamonas nauphoetae TaxID=2049346 RepID=A0ABQ9XFS7_9EUKA|nr:hypothetical protein BLNAU_14965 [Blattamonas nauphoetae]
MAASAAFSPSPTSNRSSTTHPSWTTFTLRQASPHNSSSSGRSAPSNTPSTTLQVSLTRTLLMNLGRADLVSHPSPHVPSWQRIASISSCADTNAQSTQREAPSPTMVQLSRLSEHLIIL